ncbi:MAG: HD family phosphohydrolase [Xenococcaceae cyanobacterium MO_188.B32]|nr:HD family phosphohydrolase [Xenococcaceae cyanobacterium MO_188.B32]
MKSLSSLTQKIAAWWQNCQRKYSTTFWGIEASLSLRAGKKPAKNKPKIVSYRHRKYRQRNSLFVLAIAIITLTSVIGYRFYNQPQLTVGKISPVRIEAPSDGKFEDYQTTTEKRKQVQTGIIPILKQNRETTAQIKLQISKSLDRIDQLRKLVAPFPFIESEILSLESQQYIRSCSESELKTILEIVHHQQSKNLPETTKPASNLNLRLQQTIAELKAYHQKVSAAKYNAFLARVALIRYRYSQVWKKLQQKPIARLNKEEISTLLDIKSSTWEKTKTAILQAVERMLVQGISPGMPSNLLEEAVAIQLSPEVPAQTTHIARNILLEVLQPNLEEDREATKTMAEKAALAIEPVIVEIKQGEIIVDEGEIITQADFVLLDGFGLSRRSINWRGLKISAILATASVALFWLIQTQVYTSMRRRDYILLCLLSLSAPLLTIFNIPYTNLPAVGLLVSSFYSPSLAVALVAILTGLISFNTQAISWEYLLAGSAGGLLAAAIAGKLRYREAIARLGVLVGLTQGGVYFITHLVISSSAVSIWSAVLPEAIIYGLSGVAWSIVALGISPYLERLFDVVTPIRLAELSNPNLPLLKKLVTEAPGTFQHTMFVSSLAEAAARELNCNVELIRAGTLYHDIGKMHDPLGFIENQMGGPNKHDEIDDPWKSAEIIKKHVSEGLVMARKYGLPKAIRDFIPEHQGTLLIAYFYHQAKQKAAEDPTIKVFESDFRYVGPVPQSKEAGILMLADGSEAALRSLKDVTPDKALAMIKKIFKARWQDEQLIDSGLSYDELPIIAEVFVQVWQQFNHKRIVYPKGALDYRGSKK